jgi:hypothetical protein
VLALAAAKSASFVSPSLIESPELTDAERNVMRGINLFVGTGEVGHLTSGQTTKGMPVCSFTFGMEKEDGYLAWVRVNVYGVHVDFCNRELGKGTRVLVQGELMNRARSTGGLALTEVRLLDVKVLDKTKTKCDGEIQDGTKEEG